MPTTRPRCTVTDTGFAAELLDLAQRAWAEVTDRRQRLAEDEQRRERQRVGLERAARLVDVDSLLADQAWC